MAGVSTGERNDAEKASGKTKKMSRKYRYQFTKDTFKGYIVFLAIKRKYVTYDDDLEILNYIKYKDKLRLLDKYKINYLVLDNLDIIIQKEIGNNLVKTSLL